MEIEMKQEQVNNANSAIILIVLLISQGFQSGLIGQEVIMGQFYGTIWAKIRS